MESYTVNRRFSGEECKVKVHIELRAIREVDHPIIRCVPNDSRGIDLQITRGMTSGKHGNKQVIL